MSDLPILFGDLAIPARTQVRTGYLARPGLRGSYPTVIVAHDVRGLSASLRETLRTFARHGLAAVAVDLYRGDGPGRRASREEAASGYAAVTDRRAVSDLADVLRFVESPGTEWSDPDRVGILGIGSGGRFAILAALGTPDLRAAAVVYAPLAGEDGRSPSVTELVGELEVPLLGISGRLDEVAPADAVADARTAQPRSQWAIYDDAGHGFLEDDGPDYHAVAAIDTIDRLIGFFTKELDGSVPEPGS